MNIEVDYDCELVSKNISDRISGVLSEKDN